MKNRDKSEKLQKLYYRIGEVSDLVGVEPHVLRYWESEFRSVRPQKSARGQRIYSRRDVDTLLRVKDLLYGQQFTVAGAKRRLRDATFEAEPIAPLPVTPVPVAPSPAANLSMPASDALPQAMEASRLDREALMQLKDRLLRLQERAREILQEVDAWGDEA